MNLNSHSSEVPGRFSLRTHRPGDMGLITYRHGVIYSGKPYHFDSRFEALIGRITSEFLEKPDPQRQRCWIAEREGDFLGCIMLVPDPEQENAAKLRLLLVEEKARGLGVGTALIEECVQFAKEAEYTCINLWTQSMLEGARRLYARAGFKLVGVEPHESWGSSLTGEMWQLNLP